MNNQTNLPFKKWSLKFNQCIKCGTTETRHIARGYCKNCYDRNIEGRHKEVNRQRNYGGSSSLLTKEYLLENYITNEKSLGDIAKESNCSRQYVHKKVIFYGIPLRSKASAREIALNSGKVIRENVSFKGKKQFITLEKVSFNKRFFRLGPPKWPMFWGLYILMGICYLVVARAIWIDSQYPRRSRNFL